MLLIRNNLIPMTSQLPLNRRIVVIVVLKLPAVVEQNLR
jgi:hypothetical protein